MKIVIEIEEIPTSCSTCPFYTNVPYRCHNEIGNQAYCYLGYMHEDMRDVDFYTPRLKTERYSNCQLEDNILNEHP